MVKKKSGLTFSDDSLSKSLKAPHKIHYGMANGLPIIAIGPNGGKIVGYTSKHEPIYAGSAKALELHALANHASHDNPGGYSQSEGSHAKIKAWLHHVGVTASGVTHHTVKAEHGEVITATTGLQPHNVSSGHHTFHHDALVHAIKKTPLGLLPHGHDTLEFQAAVAAGEDATPKVFQIDPSKLKEISAGNFAGSHGNKLFEAPDGTRYLYKVANPTIARAEEAASRLGALILGPGAVQQTKYAQLDGQDGVLIPITENAHELGPEHASLPPPIANMKAHAEAIAGQHVLDWLISNHDGHGGNFLVSPQGLVGIDKGQAWKFIGQDKLDVNYKPNNSAPIYNHFWKAVKDGAIPQDKALAGVSKALAALSKISLDQFRAIVAPYVALRAGKDGVPASEIEEKLVKRFKESASNWEWFLTHTLPKKPEQPKLTVTVPVTGTITWNEKQIGTIPAQPAPVVPAPVPDFAPVTKGSVTILFPGTKKPAGWHAGYPGPGFEAEVTYKGQKFKFIFGMKEGTQDMEVHVYYPDGTKAVFDSANKAADSTFLWTKKLNLHMGAVEKKKLGISYNAAKLLNLKAFDLEPYPEPTVQHVIPAPHGNPAFKTLPSPKHEMSFADMFEEAEKIAKKKKADPPPEEADHVLWALEEASKKAVDHAWKQLSITIDPAHANMPTWKINYETSSPPTYPMPKTGPIPTIPSAIFDSLSAAPSLHHNIQVNKKGLKQPVKLHKENGKYHVEVEGEKTSHASISAAADHVWAVANGHKSAAHYKQATGNTKVPSGGGKKFFGMASTDELVEQQGLPKVEPVPTIELGKFDSSLNALKFQDQEPNWPKELGPETAPVEVDAAAPPAPKAPPAQHFLGDKNPLDLAPKEAATPVKATISLLDAFKTLPETKEHTLVLKPGKDPAYYNLCYNGKGVTPEKQIQVLNEFALKHGLTPAFAGHPKANYLGAFMSVKTSDVMSAKVEHTMPAGDVPPLDVSPENNFETMPDTESEPVPTLLDLSAHPKKIYKTWDYSKKIQALKALPIGTILTLGNGFVYTKTPDQDYPDGLWTLQGSDNPQGNKAIASKIEYMGGAAVSGGPGQVVVKKAKPKPEIKSTWTPPPPDPQAQVKKEWADKHPAITTEQADHLKVWLAKYGTGSHEIYARQDGEGHLLIGDGTKDWGIKAGLSEGEAKSHVETPHGTLFRIPFADIQKSSPEAKPIKGPDGADYPHGTKFETQTEYQTLEEALKLEQGFTKFSEYKGPGDQYQKTVKVAGTTLAHKMMAEAMLKKFGLTSPVIQGTGNTMFFVSNSDLQAKKWNPTQKVTPKKPTGWPYSAIENTSLTFKGVGASLGVPNEGQPAPNNRSELSNVNTIIPFRHGYSIRFGEGGVLMDGQLRMHRIKLPSGEIVNRFVGELTKVPPELDPKLQFKHFSAAEAPDNLLGGDWKAHDYDPQTGISTMTSKVNLKNMNHSSGALLDNGAKVYVFSTKEPGQGAFNVTHARTFVVDVPVSTKNAEPALAAAMKALKVDEKAAMATPDATDERIMKKLQLLRSTIGSTGFRKIAGDPAGFGGDWSTGEKGLGLLSDSRVDREAILDLELKKHGVSKNDIDSAEVVVGHDGYHHVVVHDMDKLISSKVKGLVTGISLEGIARAVAQGGYGGQGQTLWNGNSRNLDNGAATTSGLEDLFTGGGYGKFFRLVNENVSSVSGSASFKPKMVVHPRVLKKTNWFAHNGDEFGTQRHGDVTRKKALDMTSSSNEVMIENVSAKDIVGAIVGSHQDKQKLISIFKKMGVDEVNGCPLDSFIAVGNVNHNLKVALSTLPLLKGE